jgi:hypothetical protein
VSARLRGRIVFYGLVLLALAGVAGHFWWTSVPVRVERALRGVRHPNAKVASEAWLDLHELYYTRWAAVEPIVAHALDEAPISFLVEAEKIPVPGQPARDGFSVRGKPWYHETDALHCATVGEAIRAILYQAVDVHGNPRWRSAYAGDWDAWWAENRGYYGG